MSQYFPDWFATFAAPTPHSNRLTKFTRFINFPISGWKFLLTAYWRISRLFCDDWQMWGHFPSTDWLIFWFYFSNRLTNFMKPSNKFRDTFPRPIDEFCDFLLNPLANFSIVFIRLIDKSCDMFPSSMYGLRVIFTATKWRNSWCFSMIKSRNLRYFPVTYYKILRYFSRQIGEFYGFILRQIYKIHDFSACFWLKHFTIIIRDWLTNFEDEFHDIFPAVQGWNLGFCFPR